MITDQLSGFTDTLSHWCANSPRIESDRALKLAQDAFKDTVGCMFAGANDEVTACVKTTAARLGPGRSRVVGDEARYSELGGALINGAAAHIFDYDDNFFPAGAHASAVLVPAILALGESLEADGSALLDAYIVGLEAMGRVGEAVNFEHYARGWHATSTLGPIGASAACARLLGLDHQRMHSALSLAFSMAGGSRRQMGSMAKPLHVGLAAQHGLQAAWFAADGIRAIQEPFDGKWGFRELYAGDNSPGFEGLADKIGQPLAIEEYGLMVKIYPNCASVHCTADGVISLMNKHHLRPSDIDKIKTHVPTITIENLKYPQPGNVTEARFSMGYSIGLAIEQGEMQLSDFAPESLTRPSITNWLPRVEMICDDSLREVADPANILEPAEVHLELKNGTTLHETVYYARGVLQNPVSESVMTAKFADCLRGNANAKDTSAIAGLFANIRSVTNARELTECFSR